MPSPEELGAKIDELRLWHLLEPYNLAIKPLGVAFPYFCSVMPGDKKSVNYRIELLEGWQTLHDCIRQKMDPDFGYCSSINDLPHFELVFTRQMGMHLTRFDPGYCPCSLNEKQRQIVSSILWQFYGIALRLESEPKLPMQYSDQKAIFGRIEETTGQWADAPFEIPDPPPFIEEIAVPTKLLQQVKDLPFDKNLSLDFDFRLNPSISTQEPRPRSVYELLAADTKSGALRFCYRFSLATHATMREMWLDLPCKLLNELSKMGEIPGEIRVSTGRIFRILRSLCKELPFKLSLHDHLPNLEKSIK